ncbi:hypothetical protein Tco_1540290 [Tanacetum coccineum]
MSSDSASSEVMYTSISSYGDPLAWVVDLFGLQEPDSPEVAPASPDYMPGPKEPEQAPVSSEFNPGSELPDDEEIVAERRRRSIRLRPTLSLHDSEDGPVDYPADGGDGDDDDSSNDDEEDEETEPFETDKSAATPPQPPADHITPLGARIYVRPHASMPFPSEAEVERILALPTPPPSPLISLSPPSVEERLARCLDAPALPSSPLSRVPHPYGKPNNVRAPRGFRDAMGRLRSLSPSTHHPLHPSPPLLPLPSSLYLPPPIPTSLPLPLPPLPLPPLPASLFIPPPVDRGESSTIAARPTRGHRADYGFIVTLDAKIRHQRAEEVGYGIRDVWVDPADVVEEEEDTQDLYALVKDAQDRQTRLSQRVDVLIEDREFHQETVLLMEQEALGQLSTALGQIQALQARDPTHSDDPEGADSCA